MFYSVKNTLKNVKHADRGEGGGGGAGNLDPQAEFC